MLSLLARSSLVAAPICAVAALGTSAAAQAAVVLRVVDQNEQEIAGSTITVLGSTYPSGTSALLPEGTHTFTLAPGVLGLAVTSRLARTEPVTVTSSTTELVFEWVRAPVSMRVRDQWGGEIPGSHVRLDAYFSMPGAYVPTGGSVLLPITDRGVYANLTGDQANGYRLAVLPQVLPGGSGGHSYNRLRRIETASITAATHDLDYEWARAVVTVLVHDQQPVEIPHSGVLFRSYWGGGATDPFVSSGTSLVLPVTDGQRYPTIAGDQANGYRLDVIPGVLGPLAPRAQHSRIMRQGDVAVVHESTTVLAFEWWRSLTVLRVVDQDGVDVPGSELVFASWLGVGNVQQFVPTGAALLLPITDVTVYPTLGGASRDGYRLLLAPGMAGNAVYTLLNRAELGTVTAATSALVYEWRQAECGLRLLDASDMEVAGSQFLLPSPYPAYTGGAPVRFPITENASYSNLGGGYANGYPIRVVPGDIAPTAETYQFEVLGCAAFLPASFVIGSNTYSLGCQVNRPPAVDAGENRTVLSAQLATTTILGTASDPDGDPLVYRWMLGETALAGPSLVDVAGAAPLFGPVLPIGEHLLRLDVTDGTLTASDTMVLTVGNSAPGVNATGGGAYEVGSDEVMLGASVADFDGDLLTWEWRLGVTVLAHGVLQSAAGGAPSSLPPVIVSTGTDPGALPLGAHTLALSVLDGSNAPVIAEVAVTVQDTAAPTLAPTSNVGILWPPNGAMVDITIDANAADASNGPVTLTAVVTSSEDPLKNGAGHTVPDWTEPVIDQATGTLTLRLRAERAGNGPGRTYTVTITATDASQNTTTTSLTFLAPHNRGGG